MEREFVVAAVLAASDSGLVGRVRLQKAVYLLDQLGLGSGFRYDYHHFGPYSRELDNATGDAKAFELIEEEFKFRKSDGARYSIFRFNPSAEGQVSSDAYGSIGRQRFRDFVIRFSETNVTVLELAATVDWLWRYEKIGDWRSEVSKRKNVKVGNGRLDRAVELLKAIGLSPPEHV